MEVILKQEIEKLGSKDEIVTVRPGYARNYLIPQGLAEVATKSAKKILEENQRQRAHKEEKILAEAQGIADKMGALKLSIGAKAGENGKIFGSVNSIQIAEALNKAGFEIDRRSISIAEDSIKELGEYIAKVKLHKNVTQDVTFEVVGE
ncbi:MAG: 50S ribosomal protein L9 [Flavobacteriales bacterium]|nr:50S ribosomal protein L9 [Flavobacteriales bacterium]